MAFLPMENLTTLCRIPAEAEEGGVLGHRPRLRGQGGNMGCAQGNIFTYILYLLRTLEQSSSLQ